MASATVSISAPNAEVVFGEKAPNYAEVVLRVCVERNLRYSAELVQEYIQWENATEFTRDVTLYKKVCFFFKQRVLAEKIPVFAKTMSGELLPLLYRPYCDKRNLLEQLEEIDQDLYPIGSTNIIRLVEDSTAPVEEGEIFAIIQQEFHAVQYTDLYSGDNPSVTVKDGPSITYHFKIKPKYFTRESAHLDENLDDIHVFLTHFLDKNTVMTSCFWDEYPIQRLREKISICYSTVEGRYYINQQAQQELVALFHIVRRDF